MHSTAYKHWPPEIESCCHTPQVQYLYTDTFWLENYLRLGYIWNLD